MLPIDFVLSLYIIARNKSISRINAYAVSEITLGTATCPFEFSSSTIIQKFREYSRRARACVCVWMCATYPAKMEEEKSGEQQSLNGTFYRESFQPLDRRSKARTRDSTRILNGREKCKWWLEECKRNSIRTAIEEKEKARAKQAKLPTSPPLHTLNISRKTRYTRPILSTSRYRLFIDWLQFSLLCLE